LKNRLFATRAYKLSFLFFILASLSVVVNSSNCAAKNINSPGSQTDQASVFSELVAPNEFEGRPADGGKRSRATDVATVPEAIDANSINLNGIIVSNSTPKQGEPIKVTLASDVDPSVDSISFNDQTFKLFSDDFGGKTVRSAYIAIPAQMKPGKHQITAGGAVATITVSDAHFGIQRLTLPKKVDNFNASPGEKETIGKAKRVLSDTKRWQGPFQHPAKGRMSTKFGVKRIVNGKLLTDYFHSGQDFAAPIGTPVHAAAPGRVLVAHTGWKLHGNVVVIDHGRGVISIGIHMTKVLVKEGDEVEAGQQVGTVGKTGRASGPHLHYCIYVNNEASNPDFWFRNSY
jgi:murein DD-endopeptidase MepM/ murein hydrolase activator NlpD